MNRDQCAARIGAIINDQLADLNRQDAGCTALLLAVLSAMKEPDLLELSRLIWRTLDEQRALNGESSIPETGADARSRETLAPGERLSDLRFRLLVSGFERQALRYRLKQQRLTIGLQRSRIQRQLESLGEQRSNSG